MERTVIKLSGSIFDSSPKYLKPFVQLFRYLLNEGVQPIIVAGGGAYARRYIDFGRSLGIDEASLDEIGIEASWINARLLVSALGESAYNGVPKSLRDVYDAVKSNKIVVTGGLHPGHSTNATAALIAEKTGAKLFVNATDVDGVYTSDPKRARSARKLSKVSAKALTRMLSEASMAAGGYELIDLVALKVIERSSLPTRIVKCTPKAIKDAIEGKPVGTLVAKS